MNDARPASMRPQDASTVAGPRISGPVAAGGCAVGAALYLLAYFFPADAQTIRVAGMLCIAIALYASNALPGYVTSLLVFFVATVGELAPVSVVFSGFASGAVWLLLAGTIIGTAATETGLGDLVANRLLARVQLTYTRAIVVLTSASLLLSFLVPAAIPRIVILMPLVMGIADMMGYERGSRGYTGLAIAVAGGSFYPPLSNLTATVPGIIFVGNVEAVHGIALSYSDFLLYQFPVMGALRWFCLTLLLILLFRDDSSPKSSAQSTARLQPAQRRLLIIILGLLGLWMSDRIHHVAPAWVALGAAVIMLHPRVGVLDHKVFASRADLTPLIYVAGMISLGAIVTNSDLDEIVGSLLAAGVPLIDGGMVADYFGIALLSSLGSAIVTVPAAPSLLVPLAEQFSANSELSVYATLMTQYVGMTTVVLPYQAPPLIVAIGLFGISVARMVKVTLSLFLLTLLLILPTNLLWWQAIGLVP